MRIGDELRIVVGAACATVALGLPAAAAAAETVSKSFTTAGEHEFVVPAGVTSVQVKLVGGDGAPGVGGFPGAWARPWARRCP